MSLCNNQRLAGRPAEYCRCDFFGHHICDKYETLRDGTTYCALPLHATFNDLDDIQAHNSVKAFQLKMLCSERIMLKLCMVIYHVDYDLNISLSVILAPVQGMYLTCFLIWQNTLMLTFFKLCFKRDLSNIA